MLHTGSRLHNTLSLTQYIVVVIIAVRFYRGNSQICQLWQYISGGGVSPWCCPCWIAIWQHCSLTWTSKFFLHFFKLFFVSFPSLKIFWSCQLMTIPREHEIWWEFLGKFFTQTFFHMDLLQEEEDYHFFYLSAIKVRGLPSKIRENKISLLLKICYFVFLNLYEIQKDRTNW